jgi:hypothetical protein
LRSINSPHNLCGRTTLRSQNLSELPIIFIRNVANNRHEAIMDSGFSPFDRRALTKPIVNNDPKMLQEVIDRLKSIVAVATATEDGQLDIQFIASKDTRFFDLLKDGKHVSRLSLPVYVITVKYRPASDIPPNAVR